jgi:hypothetical protein
MNALYEILTYVTYNILEKDAFQEYDKRFPPFRRGAGESPNLMYFSWLKLHKIIWNNQKMTLRNFFKIIIPILFGFILLVDLNNAINELQ